MDHSARYDEYSSPDAPQMYNGMYPSGAQYSMRPVYSEDANGFANHMACWSSGQHPPSQYGASPQIGNSNSIPVYTTPGVNPYHVTAQTAPPMFTAAPGVGGAGYVDGSMQAFQCNVGTGQSFYDSSSLGSGMPMGYYEGIQALPEANVCRKAVIKQVPQNSNVAPASNKNAKMLKKKFVPCC